MVRHFSAIARPRAEVRRLLGRCAGHGSGVPEQGGANVIPKRSPPAEYRL